MNLPADDIDFTRDEESASAALRARLEERSRRLRNNPNVTRITSRKIVEQGLLEAFELVGGVTRLAHWANKEENYGEFLKLLIKLAPREVQGEMATVIEYRSNVPPSPLNRPALEGEITDV